MILNDKVQKILFGGDYNPEQWPEEVWEEDMRLFKLAHIDVVTLNVFSWAALQPDEDTYDFSRLDRIMELVKKTASRYAWLPPRRLIPHGWRENIRISCAWSGPE